MAKVIDGEVRDQEAVREVIRDLEARPAGHQLTWNEVMGFIRRLPKMPRGWTSADDIRELRGPLPEDDPELGRSDRR
jgi:hypothetical protein